MKKSLKAALFVSAFSPCLISIGAARFLAGAEFQDAAYYIAAGVIGTLVILYILSALKWHGEAFSFQAKKIESYDALFLGILAAYLIPFFVRAADLTLLSVLALLVGGFVFFWFTDATVPSPLMRLIGFRFYKAESASGMIYTLITTRQINDPSDVKQVKRVSASMLLEVSQ